MSNIFNLVKQKVSILEIISQYTTLKKMGLYYKGMCPFHNEKTGSFTVSPAREIFYCFGCHVGGDVIAFIAKLENCSQIEAAKLIAEQYQIILPEEGMTDTAIDNKRRYINIFKTVALWAQQNLTKNKEIQEYLKYRGINQKTILEFEIGYFPKTANSINNLIEFCYQRNIVVQDLLDAHIVNKSKNIYSPFEDRILFPIKDHLGRTCGFGGRAAPITSKYKYERAKYFNSHDHPYFNKGSILFGLDKAKKAIQEKDFVFLTEGYLDVVALVQAGFINTIATLGTACTENHIKQIAKYCSKIYMVYDSDPAGQSGIIKISELCWQYNIDLYVINLPQGEDPASFLANNGNFQELFEKSSTIFEFFITYFNKDFEKKGLQEKISLVKKLVSIIKNLKDPLKQDLLLSSISETFKIDIQALKKEAEQYNSIAYKTGQNKEIDHKNNYINNLGYKTENNSAIEQPIITSLDNTISELEKTLFYGIIFNEKLFSEIDTELISMWFIEPLRLLLEKINQIKQKNNINNISNILEYLDQKEQNMISQIIIESQYKEISDEGYEQLKNQFYKKQWKIFVHNAKKKIESLQDTNDILSIQKLLDQIESIKKRVLLKYKL